MSLRTLQIGRVWASEDGGGADRVLTDLARYLPDYDVSVEAIVAGPVQDSAPVGVFSLGDAASGTAARWLGARRLLRERVTANRIDVVASHFALYASAALGRLHRMPHVVHFHGPWAAESRQEGAGRLSGATKWAIERAVYGSADRMIVLSESFARLAERSYRVNPDRLRVVPGAVDLQRFEVTEDRATARRELGWPNDRPILTTVRRLVHRTGVDRLIDALPAVVARVPDVLLCVAGKGPLRLQLEKRAEALGLQAHVRFLGYVPNAQLPILYRAADINVVPTLALEGFGLTAIEALAVGTPSLVTPVGGLPEAVGGLSPDLVFQSSVSADIAEGLSGALLGEVRMPAAEQCRDFVGREFSADLMARRTAAVYRELLA